MKTSQPLTPAVFHILLALSDGEKHGYAIMKQIDADSGSSVRMGPGTLYGSLNRMLDAGLIAESEKRVDPEMDDSRRIYYKITSNGTKALSSEIERFDSALRRARELKLAPGKLADAK